MFKVAISISTIASCGILCSPTIGHGGGSSVPRSTTSRYKFFAVFYAVAMLAAFTLGFLLLVLSVPVGPQQRAAAATAARKLIMWVSLWMVYVAVVAETFVALVESLET